jgi:hypothetical protein
MRGDTRQRLSKPRCKDPMSRVIFDGFSGVAGWSMSVLARKRQDRGRARSVAFARTPVIQTPELGVSNHAL